MSAKLTAYIIGSGIAGIATAIRLAVQNYNVTVFEKNNYPGGKINVLKKDGYTFDTGPSLFVQPENVEELFKLAGEDIHEYFSYKPLNIACKYFYEDGTIVNAYTDKEKFAEELFQKTGEPKQNTISYLNESQNIYKHIGNIFLNHSLHKRSTLRRAKIARALLNTKPSYLFSTLHQTNTKKFNKLHSIQLFNRYATYSGSNPYKAPGMLKLIPHIEYSEGVFYPEGGMIAIVNALYKLAEKKDVQFKFNTKVERIIEFQNEAKGVVINEKNLFGDVIISNTDVYFTYLKLLNDERAAKKILKRERSSSALIFYWGIKKEFPQLELHNIFFTKDYKKEFDSIFKLKNIYNDPTIYINITSKCEPGVQAPAGKENWFVMINVAADVKMSEEDFIKMCRQNILAKLSRILNEDIESLIETEAVLHPKMIEELTSSYLGALYGTSSNSKRSAFFRHPNFSKDIKHLYFTGGSVHPGGGIPLCLKSAKITADIITEDSRKWAHHHE
jgi:phytoene desaturase